MDSNLDRSFNLPHGYGDNKIVLMVRDPWTLYTYWEIAEAAERSVKEQIQAKGLKISNSILRLCQIDGSGNIEKIFSDFQLKDNANNWYINKVNPDRKWRVDIGILCSNGEFFPLAQSNVVETPRSKMSDVCDGKWASIRKLVARHLKEWQTSGGVSSGMSGGGGGIRR